MPLLAVALLLSLAWGIVATAFRVSDLLFVTVVFLGAVAAVVLAVRAIER